MGDDDPGRDIYPVKETMTSKGGGGAAFVVAKDDGKISSQPNERQRTVSKWTRHELEDYYFRVYEENLVLKKHAHRQEDRIKRMTTKLLRLTSDRKKFESEKRGDENGVKKRDIEMEQLVEEQQDRLRELEKQNKLLQEKLIVVRQQLATQLKRPVPAIYRRVSSRTDSGLPRYAVKPGSTLQGNGRSSHYPYPSYAASPDVVEKLDVINDATITHLRDQLVAYEQEILTLKDQFQTRQAEHEEEMFSIKSQLTNDQRKILHENVSVIRLQRDLKQKSSQLLALEAECAKLEDNLRSSRQDYEHIIANFDTLNYQLKDEQERNSSLQSEVGSLATLNIMIAECKEKISDLEKENKILKDSNNKLTESALDYEKLKPTTHDTQARPNLPQFETAMKFAVDRSDALREELNNERILNQKLHEEIKHLRISLQTLEERRNELHEKLQFFTKDEANPTEFQEALANVQRRRESALQVELCLQSQEDDSKELLKKSLIKVQADHAETISELEKVRDMLVVQHRINRDYHQEIETLSQKLAQTQQECEDRLVEQNQILEQRSVRIQLLERKLKDVAYGTSQSKHYMEERNKTIGRIGTTSMLAKKSLSHLDSNTPEDTSNASPGVNELHVKLLRCQGLKAKIEGMQPSSYCVYKFYKEPDHDTTIITSSNNPEFQDHSILRVSVDLDLDRYLQTESLEIFVFDDYDPDLTSYLGLARIPLLALTNNKTIKGTFEIKQKNGQPNGTIDVCLYWQYKYISPEELALSSTMQSVHVDDSEHPNDVTDVTMNSDYDGEKSSFPTPKPRTVKVISGSDETKQGFYKKPPIAPRMSTVVDDTLKSMDNSRLVDTTLRTPQTGPQQKSQQPISSFSSDSSSDDDTYVVSKPSGIAMSNSPAKLPTKNGISATSKNPEVGQRTSSNYSSNTESDSDIIVVPPETVKPDNAHPDNTVVILISHLSFTTNAAFLHNDAIQMLFVEYRFLDFPQEELETPFALPKPIANQKIVYNFRKVFHFDKAENEKRCQLFSAIISSSLKEKKRIKFTIVSEPPEDDSNLECEDIGHAYVDLGKIVASKKDITDEDIDVFDAINETTIIGHLNISIHAIAAINYILGKKFLNNNRK